MSTTHSHVNDSGGYFIVDPATRSVIAPDGQRVLGAVGDHLSEQITFEIPQRVDGHDITKCGHKYVTWRNVNGDIGHDELHLTRTADGKAYFTWTIRGALTDTQGFAQFSLHFEDVDEYGTTTYRWGTANIKNCEIIDSVNASVGVYESIYVEGDTLVIEDYAPVKDFTLTIGPTSKPTTVEVDNETGVITVDAGGEPTRRQVTTNDIPDLLPRNILSGCTILGVKGDHTPLVRGQVIHKRSGATAGSPGAFVYYTGESWSGANPGYPYMANAYTLNNNSSYSGKFVKDTPIIIVPMSGTQVTGYTVALTGPAGLLASAIDGSVLVVRPTGDDFTITISEK